MTNFKKVRRALISVSDKTGIIPFAKALQERGIDLLSTGGTYNLLLEQGISVTEVSSYTNFPEMMAGRVKTLHPKIHGGILGRRGIDDDVMSAHSILPIDLVLVNLYPFEQAIADPNCSLGTAIENIDIGGPTMVRAAAKNHNDVAIVVNSSDYSTILAALDRNEGSLDQDLRFDLAVKAFEHTAAYDGAIANFLGTKAVGGEVDFPRTLNIQLKKTQTMRYGENPHQRSAFYLEKNTQGSSVATASQIQGKELSHNNIADTDAAFETVKQFSGPSCVIVKHANPCGVAVRDSLLDAYNLAYQTDPESAFGGIIAFNAEVTNDVVETILDRQFVEVIIAPSYSEEATKTLSSKPNVRVLATGPLNTADHSMQDYKKVTGGLLLQDRDTALVQEKDLEIVTHKQPTPQEIQDLLFTWSVAKMVKSNAIVYGKNQQTIGIGAGQMSRINSARIAAIKAEHAGLKVQGCSMASDAFFPFRDGIDNAAKAGITTIIQPGGSMRDDEVIAAANEHNIAMVFTSMRHFRH